jgi:hypothetical protein
MRDEAGDVGIVLDYENERTERARDTGGWGPLESIQGEMHVE